MLKKLIVIFLVVFLAACGTKEEKGSTEESKEPEMVEVTIPSIFFDGVPDEQIIAEAEKLGISETTVGEEKRNVTYVMTKEKQDELLEGLEENLDDFFEYLLKTLSSFKGIDHNKQYDDFTVTVNKEDYLKDGNVEGYGALGILQRARYYHYFKGTSEEDIKITLTVKDEETEEVIEKVVYPDDVEK